MAIKNILAFFCVVAFSAVGLAAPKFIHNYDESKADAYKKLDTLDKIGGNGKIKTAIEWLNCERPKVVAFLENEYFGKMPPFPKKLEFILFESFDNALEGTAMRKQFKIVSTDANGSHSFDVLVYIPKSAKKPVPVFVNANFSGNHSTVFEKEIPLAKCYLRNSETWKISDNKAHEYQRGASAARHPMKEIVARGYAVATFCYCDVYADMDAEKRDGFDKSIYKIFNRAALGKNPRSIAAWAWGNSRVLDLLESLPEIDASRAAVVGHSRIGKTAMLTAVYDVRFAMSVSNSSCVGGAAMNRRNFGETMQSACYSFPYWYLPEMKKYGENIESMPIDQQHFLAAIAPRPVAVLSGSEDLWADPKGEYLSLVEASKIYALFGAKDLPDGHFPDVEKPFIGDVGYMLYKGKHAINLSCWNFIMDFADKALRSKTK